ncbi:MAG: class I SAM-dependent methyltransferase, partial [Myxococcales bacterium]|nr:class I SAM-dependent methyltransferase [Myxococcales bacterium]
CFQALLETECYRTDVSEPAAQPVYDALWACERCDVLYPVLGGIPILTVDPADWLATYWDAALATLAEALRLGPHTVSLAKQIAMTAAGAEPRRFGDDWVAHEREGLSDLPRPPFGETTLHDTDRQAPTPTGMFSEWINSSRQILIDSVLDSLEPTNDRLVIEVGPGAGTLTTQLAKRGAPTAVIDISLRSVLISLQTVEPGTAVFGIVADAEALPISTHVAGTIVAMNVVDLLDHPEKFLLSARRVLTDGGQLVLTTPRPDLYRAEDPSEGEHILDEMVEAAGFGSISTQDALPWIRAHHSRHYEIYWAMLLTARKTGTKIRSRHR